MICLTVDIVYWTKVGKRLFVFIFTILGIYLAFKLAIFYMPFFIAFIISLILDPAIRFLASKTTLPRKTSAVMILTIVSILAIGFISLGIVSIISESSNLLQGLNEYIEKIYLKCNSILSGFETKKIKLPEGFLEFINTSSQDLLQMGSGWLRSTLGAILQWLTSLPSIFIYVGITLVSTYFICTDKFSILDQIEHHMPRNWITKFLKNLRKIIASIGNYFKAELILVTISFIITLIGLYFMNLLGMNVKYPLLAALAIGFVDALPILGSGTVLIPWAIISAVDGDIKLAISLLALLAIISIVRQLMEPKVISKQIGIHPICTLIAMYTGYKSIGILGLLLGPIVLIIFSNVFETIIDQGVLKSIFDKK